MVSRPKLIGELINHEGMVRYMEADKFVKLKLVLGNRHIKGYECGEELRSTVDIDLHHLVSVQRSTVKIVSIVFGSKSCWL